MGAYDEILYNGKRYQTKSLVCWQDKYEVRDGELWHEEYDTEDRSDPNAKGIARLFGMCAAVNHRWIRDRFTGTVYTWQGPALTFEKGKLTHARQWNEQISEEQEMNE